VYLESVVRLNTTFTSLHLYYKLYPIACLSFLTTRRPWTSKQLHEIKAKPMKLLACLFYLIFFRAIPGMVKIFMCTKKGATFVAPSSFLLLANSESTALADKANKLFNILNAERIMSIVAFNFSYSFASVTFSLNVLIVTLSTSLTMLASFKW
jgi:hypothetical protein